MTHSCWMSIESSSKCTSFLWLSSIRRQQPCLYPELKENAHKQSNTSSLKVWRHIYTALMAALSKSINKICIWYLYHTVVDLPKPQCDGLPQHTASCWSSCPCHHYMQVTYTRQLFTVMTYQSVITVNEQMNQSMSKSVGHFQVFIVFISEVRSH